MNGATVASMVLNWLLVPAFELAALWRLLSVPTPVRIHPGGGFLIIEEGWALFFRSGGPYEVGRHHGFLLAPYLRYLLGERVGLRAGVRGAGVALLLVAGSREGSS